GAQRMSELPLSGLVHARLLPVSHWPVCASLDALDHHRFSHIASPFHPLPSTGYSANLRCVAWLSCVYGRVGDRCGRSSVPLPAGVQSPRAPADQMGDLRVRCADHGLCDRDCAVSAVPSARWARFTVSAGLRSRPSYPAALDPTLVWVRHAALSAV